MSIVNNILYDDFFTLQQECLKIDIAIIFFDH